MIMKLLKKLLLSVAAMAVTALLCMVCVGAEKSGFWEYSINNDGTVTITGYSGFSVGQTLTIPAEIDGKKVTSIKSRVFESKQTISKVVISEGIVSLGYSVFEESSVTEVVIPSTITGVDKYAFQNCKNLTKVTYNGTYIGYCMFDGCSALKTVVLGDNVTEIDAYAFQNTSALDNFTFNSNLKVIKWDAFNSSGLTSCILPDSLEEIGESAFAYTPVTEVSIPSSVIKFGGEEFYKCKNLTKATINSTSVSQYMFSGCDSLKTVVLGDNVNVIGYNSFSYCPSLKNFTMGVNVTKIDSYAFEYSGIEEIVLPDVLSYMGSDVFRGSKLKEIILPSSISYWYSDGQFNNCSNLEKVVIGDCELPSRNVFFNAPATIYCMPDSKAEAYAKSNGIPYKTTIKRIPVTSIKFNKSAYTLKVGETLRLFPQIAPINYTDGLAWMSGDENIATVNSAGVITGVSEGLVAITCQTSGGKIAYCEVTVTADKAKKTSVDTVNKKDIRKAVTRIESVTYKGSSISAPVIMYNDVTKLQRDVDYTYTFKHDGNNAVITIAGKGRYNSSISYVASLNGKFKKVDLNGSGFSTKSRSTSSIKLGWKKCADADGYAVQMYKNGAWKTVKTISGNSNITYTQTGLTAGTVYKFRLLSFKTSGSLKAYGAAMDISSCTLPSKVSSFKASSKTNNTIKLTWAKNSGATGYILEQYKGNKWVRIAKTTKNTTTSYTVKGLSASTRYAFRIVTYKELGSGAVKGAYTNKLVVYTNPNAMSGFKASAKTKTTITLSWNKNTSATGYIIEQYNGTKWVRIAKIDKNSTTSYKVTGLKANTRYAFRIQAYKNIPGSAVRSAFTSKLVVYTAK